MGDEGRESVWSGGGSVYDGEMDVWNVAEE